MDGRIRLVEILGAFAIAGDLGRGQPEGHVLRTCQIALRLADTFDLTERDRAAIYYTALLVHAGCTAGSAEFAAFLASDELAAQRDLCLCDSENLGQLFTWVRGHVAPAAGFPERTRRTLQALFVGEKTMAEFELGCSDVGSRIAARLGMSEETQQSLFNICETWNGNGPYKLKGEAIPLPARIVNAAMILEVFHDAQGREGAVAAATRRRGRSIDPDVAAAFITLAEDEGFWDELAADDPWQAVLALEPEGPRRFIDERDLDAVCLAFADFIDLKSARAAAHSRRVAEVAEAIARRLDRTEEEVTLVRRAALVHALGQVAVPNQILEKAGPLTAAEQERLRLHPYYTERILSRAAVLKPIGAVAGTHHERLDGDGYHRGLSDGQLSIPARILAVADRFIELTDSRPGQETPDVDAAVRAIEPDIGCGLDRDCFNALLVELGTAPHKPPARRQWPAGLTDREVEVLRLIARGVDRRRAAQELVVSEHTVRHHLESIYSKIGVHSRAGAVLFAVEQDLLYQRSATSSGVPDVRAAPTDSVKP